MKFIWQIENFRDLKDEMLQSPSFEYASSVWEVIVYEVEESSDDNHISIQLKQLGRRPLTLNCSFAFLDSAGSPLIWKDMTNLCFKTKSDYQGPYLSTPNTTTYFIKRSDFDSRITEFLPNNNLIIQCLLWETSNELVDPRSLFALTRIEPRTKVIENTFDWDIIEASSLQQGNISEHVEILTTNGEFLTILLALNSVDNLEVTFKVSMFRCHMKVKISLLDAMGMKQIQFVNDHHDFKGKGNQWTLSTNISKNMIMSHQNLFLSNDSMSIQFICTFSDNIILNRMGDESEIIFNSPRPIENCNQVSKSIDCVDEPPNKELNKSEINNSILQTLQDIYKEGFLSDFNLRVGDRVFPVHKAILGARSQVFRAMVTTEMKEKEDNIVDIQDMDGDTLQRMLLFVYSDRLDEDLEWESASNLYAAADKYALEPLKQGCSFILKSGLCVSSVLEVLAMADMHHDQELKSAALDFILWNDKEIVGTERWIKFEEENAKLAVETCRKLYLKKMNV